MINNKWIMTEPRFESDIINPQLRFAYWEGHRDFVYDLINFVKPKMITELGSQYGCSLFTFCQSVKDNNLDTKIRAVDMWSGDIGAPDTGEEVFALVNKIKDTYFSELDIKLYQMRFDDALPDFEDESIDILHIDGGHTFEDVDHDLKTWLPKLSKDGIILFHDVYSTIDDGSCVHWRETKKKYKNFFDFEHSCGLGVLFPKSDKWYNLIRDSGFFELYKDVYYYRSKYKYVQNRFDELSGLYEERYKAIEEQSEMIKERDERIEATEKLAVDRLKAIEEQSEMIKERDERIEATEKLAVERLKAIDNQSAMIAERDEKINVLEDIANERLNIIKEKEAHIAGKDIRIKEVEDKHDELKKIIDNHIMSRWEYRKKFGGDI